MIFEMDNRINEDVIDKIKKLEFVFKVIAISPVQEE